MHISYSYLRYADMLLDVFSSCSLYYYQSFMRNQETKTELQKKVHRRICVRDITFLAPHPSHFLSLFFFFCLLPSPTQVTYLLNDNFEYIAILLKFVVLVECIAILFAAENSMWGDLVPLFPQCLRP